MIVVSPHYDDAALSVGAYIADAPSHTDITVTTIYGGMPTTGYPLTQYDVACGFTDPREAMRERKLENERAMIVLDAGEGADALWTDQQYGAARPHPAEMVRWIEGEIVLQLANREAPPPIAEGPVDPKVDVLVPLGLLHQDHIDVADAGLALRSDARVDLYLYEELPYRVQMPNLVVDRLKRLDNLGIGRVLIEPVASVRARAIKRAAVGCYRSQLDGIDLDCCFVPERLWKITAE